MTKFVLTAAILFLGHPALLKADEINTQYITEVICNDLGRAKPSEQNYNSTSSGSGSLWNRALQNIGLLNEKNKWEKEQRERRNFVNNNFNDECVKSFKNCFEMVTSLNRKLSDVCSSSAKFDKFKTTQQELGLNCYQVIGKKVEDLTEELIENNFTVTQSARCVKPESDNDSSSSSGSSSGGKVKRGL